jgi:hypothetical protein
MNTPKKKTKTPRKTGPQSLTKTSRGKVEAEQKPIYVHGIECPVCKEQLYSKRTHDWRPCKCSYCYVDGGREYMRVGYGVYIDGEPLLTSLINTYFGPPKTIKIRLEK